MPGSGRSRGSSFQQPEWGHLLIPSSSHCLPRFALGGAAAQAAYSEGCSSICLPPLLSLYPKMDSAPHTHFCVTVIDGLYFFIITWTLVVFILAKRLVLICVFFFFWRGGSELADCSKTWAGVGGSLLCFKYLITGNSIFYETYLDSMPEIWKHMYKNHFYVLFLINHCV